MKPIMKPVKTILAVCLTLCLSMFFSMGMASPTMAATEQEVTEATELWNTSVHALNDVNCASCHQDSETKEFIANPSYESCQSCHEDPVSTFLLGKHGIRLLEGESALTPAMAHIPMKKDAMDKQMNCNTCHNVHSVDTVQASVDACLTCHDDTHSLNYQNSRHAELFLASKELPRPGPGAVTCATCHLPRTGIEKSDDTTLVKVNHNNTYNLKPADRMVGEVCMNCHGVEYAYNSIFDPELVESNFDRPPSLELQTFELMEALEARRVGESSDQGAE